MFRFALTIFISAFLLFQIQPIIAKYILPWYGGTASVWTVCLLFFQATLLLGYCYAHILRICLKIHHQAIVHVFLIVCALAVLPVTPDLSLKPVTPESPLLGIWITLLVTIGLPYCLISASGPLLQYWFKQRFPSSSPYRLYALSNVGSLLALLTYPFLIEPILTLQIQSWFWSTGFFVYVLLCSSCAWSLRLVSEKDDPSRRSEQSVNRWDDRILWVLLSASATTLLMSSTNQVCQNVASVPFLWLLPLSLYLLSFIICFDRAKWYDRRFWLPALFISVLFGLYCLLSESSSSIQFQVLVYSSILFTGCMSCHGEVVRLKPHPDQLTIFYLLISLGGALGGIFVTLIAPQIFNGYWELQLIWCVILILLGACVFKGLSKKHYWSNIAMQAGWVTLCACIAMFLVKQVFLWSQDIVDVKRNFYGVLRVQDIKNIEDSQLDIRNLKNGTILHGNQMINAQYTRLWPTTYYGYKSGIGIAIHEHPKHLLKTNSNNEFRIGVVGMGVATISALATHNDVIRFYEINPSVVEFSKKYFTYLQDTLARWEIVLGDARISMEQELDIENKQNFDVLAIDAFSGDSIPTHLLTIESFKVYWQHLNEDGILAIHISNLHVDLRPVVRQAAAALNKSMILIKNIANYETSAETSVWVLMTNNNDFLQRDDVVINSSNDTIIKNVALWTDDYSNLFSVLK